MNLRVPRSGSDLKFVSDARGGRVYLFKRMIYNAQKRAERQGWDFDISLAWLESRLPEVEYRCEVTGTKFSDTRIGHKRPFLPSIDRKHSKLGYTQSNCRLVCVCVNVGMSDWGEEVYFEILKNLAGQPWFVPTLNRNKRSLACSAATRKRMAAGYTPKRLPAILLDWEGQPTKIKTLANLLRVSITTIRNRYMHLQITRDTQ